MIFNRIGNKKMRDFPRLADLAELKGQEIGTSEWVTITQQMINDFAEVTGDNQWIHVDPERTKAELDISTIAHGFLTISMLPRFMQEVFHVQSVQRIINYGSNKIRFISMVPVNSRIRGRAVLAKAVLGNGRLRANFEISVEMEGADKPVAFAESIVLMFE
jgi:acyl dehydratase